MTVIVAEALMVAVSVNVAVVAMELVTVAADTVLVAYVHLTVIVVKLFKI